MTEKDARAVLSKYKKFELFLRTNKILTKWINAYIKAGKPERANWVEVWLIDHTLVWADTDDSEYWYDMNRKFIKFYKGIMNEI